MSSLPLSSVVRARPARTSTLRVLPHESGFFALYAFVLVRLLLSPFGTAWVEVAVWLGFLMVSLSLVVLTESCDRPWAWRVRLGSYVVLMNAAYFRMGSVVAAIGAVSQDAPLQRLDTLLFGRPLPLYFDASHRAVSELLSICYFLLFPYILLSCGRQLIRYSRAPHETRAFYTGLFLVYAIGFIGYLLVPARGPWLAMPTAFPHAIARGWFTAFNQSVVDQNSNRVDVFPSLHVAASAFMLFFDRRFARWRYRIYLPAAIGLWISTVYLRFHYGVDVLAGGVVALIGLRVAFAIARPSTLDYGATTS